MNAHVNIHVIYTGGTIGMRQTDDGLVPDSNVGSWVDKQLADTEFEGHVHVHQLDPLIDSSNATALTWQSIIDAVRSLADDATGFVILHGTDTMAYSAAALSYALADLEVPIVITGSQLPITHFGSDALTNLIGALQAAVRPNLRGVYIFFGTHLLRGNRSTKVSAWNVEAFASPSVPAVAQSGGPWNWAVGFDPTNAPIEPKDGAPSEAAFRPYRQHDVVVIHLVPGMTAGRLKAMLSPLPEAVILRGYGTGNIPADEPAFLDVLRDAAAHGCLFVVTTQTQQALVNLDTYATGKVLNTIGAVSGGDATLEALYAKLQFLLSQGFDAERVRDLVSRSIAGEMS